MAVWEFEASNALFARPRLLQLSHFFYRYEGGEVALGRLMHGAQDLGDVLGD